MKLTLLIKLAVAASLSMAPFQYASAVDDPSYEISEMMKKHKKGLMKKIKELDLSEEQKEKLKAIKERKKASRAEKKANRQKIKAMKEQLQAEFKGTKSSSELRALHKEIKTLHTRLQEERFNTILEIREILTPDQRAQMNFFPIQKTKKE